MKVLRAIIFYVLAIIYVPLSIFMHITFKWWEGLLD